MTSTASTPAMFLGNARSAMTRINPLLADRFEKIAEYIIHIQPVEPVPSNSGFGTISYFEKIAMNFDKGRTPKYPSATKTHADRVVPIILRDYFNVPELSLPEVIERHRQAMASENIIGHLLERYLAETVEPYGWIWCAGSTIRAVDFMIPNEDNPSTWRLLQVKNRDNSENSSSSAIRSGTLIEKWFRSFSAKDATNWDNFPAENAIKDQLSENAFIDFVSGYIRRSVQAQNQK